MTSGSVNGSAATTPGVALRGSASVCPTASEVAHLGKAPVDEECALRRLEQKVLFEKAEEERISNVREPGERVCFWRLNDVGVCRIPVELRIVGHVHCRHPFVARKRGRALIPRYAQGNVRNAIRPDALAVCAEPSPCTEISRSADKAVARFVGAKIRIPRDGDHSWSSTCRESDAVLKSPGGPGASARDRCPAGTPTRESAAGPRAMDRPGLVHQRVAARRTPR